MVNYSTTVTNFDQSWLFLTNSKTQKKHQIFARVCGFLNPHFFSYIYFAYVSKYMHLI